jgi:hypothetical protein
VERVDRSLTTGASSSATAEDDAVSTTDAQVRKLMEEMTKQGHIGLAAMRAGWIETLHASTHGAANCRRS